MPGGRLGDERLGRGEGRQTWLAVFFAGGELPRRTEAMRVRYFHERHGALERGLANIYPMLTRCNTARKHLETSSESRNITPWRTPPDLV